VPAAGFRPWRSPRTAHGDRPNRFIAITELGIPIADGGLDWAAVALGDDELERSCTGVPRGRRGRVPSQTPRRPTSSCAALRRHCGCSTSSTWSAIPVCVLDEAEPVDADTALLRDVVDGTRAAPGRPARCSGSDGLRRIARGGNGSSAPKRPLCSGRATAHRRGWTRKVSARPEQCRVEPHRRRRGAGQRLTSPASVPLPSPRSG
jgi:hypothetical protein